MTSTFFGFGWLAIGRWQIISWYLRTRLDQSMLSPSRKPVLNRKLSQHSRKLIALGALDDAVED